MALNLNNLLRELGATAQARQAGTVAQVQQINADTAQMQNLMTLNIAESRAAADTTAAIVAREAELAARQAQAHAKATAIVGLSPEDLDNELVRSIAEHTTAETERKQVRNQFERLNQISILDNPLAFIAAQLQLPQVAQRNNELVATRDAATRNIRTRQELLRAHKDTVTINTATEAKDIAVDRAANARRIADIQLREAELGNVSRLAGQRLTAFNMSERVFDIQANYVESRLRIGEMMANAQERAAARAERAAAAAVRNREAADKAEVDAMMNVQLQRVSQFMGLQVPMTLDRLRTIPDARTRTAWIEAATTGSFGGNLTESVAFLRQSVPAMRVSNPGAATAIELMDKGLATTRADIVRRNERSATRMTPAQIDAAAAEEYVELMRASANAPSATPLTSPVFDGVGTGDRFNVYRAQHRLILADIAARPDHPLRNNRLAALLVAAAPGTGNISSEQEQQAIRAMAELVRSGKVLPQDAARQHAEYFRFSAAKNLDMFQYTVLNLPPQTRYFGQIMPPGAFAEAITADFMNETQVKNAYSQMARQSRLLGTEITAPQVPVMPGATGIILGEFLRSFRPPQQPQPPAR